MPLQTYFAKNSEVWRVVSPRSFSVSSSELAATITTILASQIRGLDDYQVIVDVIDSVPQTESSY